MEKVAVKKLRPGAVMPKFGSKEAAGADLYACLEESVIIAPGQTVFIPTGLAMALPRGYVDGNGEVHKNGRMRLATAVDEISATRDPRVLSNPSYLTIVVLSKVVTELEGIPIISPNIIERLFTADLAFLQDMYQRIYDVEPPVMKVVCPHCGEEMDVPLNFTMEG